MGYYRKKPVVIQALQVKDIQERYDHGWDLPEWVRAGLKFGGGLLISDEGIHVETMEGIMLGGPDWWLIQGVKGEMYPCEDEIFQATYEPVEEPRFETSDEWGTPFDPSANIDKASICEYGSCVMPVVHMGPHRCKCGRPCDDPELNCEGHLAGWANQKYRPTGMDVLARMDDKDEYLSDGHGGINE